ncbi:MAG: MBL fold metallo-hydrolase [Cyclobacteriaceae bacterium]|nr:MBL fold metallo-hydrolase [Cyclobacteriaceae bacterium]
MLSIQTFVFNPFAENTYVVSDETGAAVIIDPGCYEAEEQDELDEYIASHQLSIKYLLNTHCHIDHVLGNYYVKKKYQVPLLLHAREENVLRAVKTYAPNYGFAAYQETAADRFLEEGEKFSFGNTTWDILFLPGHAPGHVGFYDPKEKVIFSGDVLFNGSIGRTDLPGGDYDTLIQSIRQKMFLLPDDVVVYCGHGSTTLIGREKLSNPYCGVHAKV